MSAPRYPGEKVGFWRTLKFYLTGLMAIPGFIAARPAVVDSRAKEVRPSVPHSQTESPIRLQFLTKIKAERGYKSIGVAGSVSIFISPNFSDPPR